LVKRSEVLTVSPTQKATLTALGENDYFTANVWSGKGRQFLPQEVVDIWEGAGTVENVDVPVAANLAYHAVQAAARMTGLITPPTGIGGSIRVLLVGSGKPEWLTVEDNPRQPTGGNEHNLGSE
jgi:hypothetical protein